VVLATAAALFLGAQTAGAQAAAEYAGAVSAVSGVSASAKPISTISIPSPPKGKPKFLHVAARSVEEDMDANRRALEEGAGEEAAKLLLRSVPSEAAIWVDGKRVGSTPLLLILPPGSYQVEMRAWRTYARHEVELGAKDNQDVLMTLTARYPAQVRLR
jgi:hypothetical protein